MTATASATSTRGGEAGPAFPQVPIAIAVGAITAPAELTVTGTNDSLKGCTGLAAQFDGAPSSVRLNLLGAWMTNVTTGAFALRFGALGANYAGATENILLQVLQTG